MDLVGYDEAVYDRITAEFSDWAAKLDVHDIQFIPISALHGDNVVQRSMAMPWYQGPSLLYHLEHVYIGSDVNLIDVRFPVQWVIRPQSDEHHDFRGYAGQVASGMFRIGDEVVVLPSGKRSRVKSISTFDGELERGLAAPVGHHAARGRHRRLARRRHLPAAQPARGQRTTSRPWSAG